MSSDADRLLAGCCIDNEQGFLRLQEIFERFQFLNQRFVDLLPAGRIKDVDARCARRSCPTNRCGNSAPDVFLVGIGRKHGNLDLLSERHELLNGGWPLQRSEEHTSELQSLA